MKKKDIEINGKKVPHIYIGGKWVPFEGKA